MPTNHRTPWLSALLALALLGASVAHADARPARPARGDHRPPEVVQLTPAAGERMHERGRTFIHARLQDEGSGVDARSIRLVVDDLDVTRDARVSADEIGYRERLGRGVHRAELLVRDRAGNLTRMAWAFRVV